MKNVFWTQMKCLCTEDVNSIILINRRGFNWFYRRSFCLSDIDECAGNVCQNGATCEDGINLYTCTCEAGYDGNFCQNSMYTAVFTLKDSNNNMLSFVMKLCPVQSITCK